MYLAKKLAQGAMVLAPFLTGLMLIFLPLAPAGATPVIMVLGDSLVAGHGLPQGQAFPDILTNKLATDGIDVTMINAGGYLVIQQLAAWRGLTGLLPKTPMGPLLCLAAMICCAALIRRQAMRI